jgi:hypothetical protein
MIELTVQDVVCPHCGISAGTKIIKAGSRYFTPGKDNYAHELYARCYSCKKPFLIQARITVNLLMEALEPINV